MKQKRVHIMCSSVLSEACQLILLILGWAGEQSSILLSIPKCQSANDLFWVTIAAVLVLLSHIITFFYMYLPSVQEEGKGVLSNVLYYIHQGTLYLSPETLSGLEVANQLSPLSSAFIEYVIYYGFHCLALRVNTLLFCFYYFILMRFQEGK